MSSSTLFFAGLGLGAVFGASVAVSAFLLAAAMGRAVGNTNR